jgi:hypothetical protein
MKQELPMYAKVIIAAIIGMILIGIIEAWTL